MIKRAIILMSIGLITSCSNSDDDNQTTKAVIKSVTDEIGTIGLMNVNGTEKFTINTTIPETIDSQITGIVSELPLEFNTVGTSVVFSGTYSSGENTPSPILGGQTVYDLTLSSIRKNESLK